MDDRNFMNPFEDFNGNIGDYFDTSTNTWTTTFLEKLNKNIHDLLKKMEMSLEECLDWHDYTVYTGTSGIAMLYLHLFETKKDGQSLEKCIHYIEKPLQQLKCKRLTFLCGDAGPLTVGVLAYQLASEKDKANDCLKKLTDLHSHVMCDKTFPNEMLFGRAGYLWSLMHLQQTLGEDTVQTKLIDELYESILEQGRREAKEDHSACPLMYQWHEKQYLGAAHGLTGILYLLLHFTSDKHQKNLHELVRPTIDYLITLKYPSGNFPSSNGSQSGDKLVQWCHGAPGWVAMFLKAQKVFQDEKYLTEALVCGDVVWSRGLLKKGYSLCHGSSGNAYTFLALYQATKDYKHLYRAAKFAEWCCEYGKHGCRQADRPMSLFEGLAGNIYFLVDMLNPAAAKFPAVELN